MTKPKDDPARSEADFREIAQTAVTLGQEQNRLTAKLVNLYENLPLAAAAHLYVGDAVRDIEAGHAAGMRTIAAAWGYIRPQANPRDWGADVVIRHPEELLDALDRLDSHGA